MTRPNDLAPRLSSIRTARLARSTPDERMAGIVAETGELVDKAAEGA